jgi:uroporphyrinogen-III synthase
VTTSGSDPGFGGARVLVLESRLATETAAMVRRLGGDPVIAPSVVEMEVNADAPVESLVEALEEGNSVAVFLTAVAVNRLFAIADRLGLSDRLGRGLRAATTIARGPKPAGALARRGVPPAHTVAEPFTTTDVIRVLERIPVQRRDVTVVHYGERNETLVRRLRARGADLRELSLYEWRLPQDTGPLSAAIDAVILGEIPIVTFTSQIQVRHMIEIAGPRRERLVEALNEHVLVGAVGPTCAAGCMSVGVRPHVVPGHPKLGALLTALVQTYTTRSAPIGRY